MIAINITSVQCNDGFVSDIMLLANIGEPFQIPWRVFVRPFLELPEFQTFFCPFSVLRIFRFLPLRHLLALPEFVYVDFEGVYSPVTVPFMKVRGKCARQLLHTHEETLPLTVVACNLPLFSW